MALTDEQNDALATLSFLGFEVKVSGSVVAIKASDEQKKSIEDLLEQLKPLSIIFTYSIPVSPTPIPIPPLPGPATTYSIPGYKTNPPAAAYRQQITAPNRSVIDIGDSGK